MRELELMKDKLKFKEELVEKELINSSANVLDNLTDKVKDLAFDLGTHFAMQIVSFFRRKKSAD